MVTRRQFLTGLAGTGAAVALGACSSGADEPSRGSTSTSAVTTATRAPTGSSAEPGTLVVVTLYGGNDGLDTVIPAADPAYRSARGALARSPEEVLDLGEGFGFHPALTRLQRQWQDERLAIVRGVGFADLDRSHFHCMDVWQAGGEGDLRSGWLGRWLDTGKPDPFAAVAVGDTLPLLLQGEKRTASVVPVEVTPLPGASVSRQFAAMSRTSSGPPLLVAAAQAGEDMLAVDQRVSEARRPVAGSGLPAQLDLVASLIEADLPTRVYAASMPGFDTHAGEKPTRDQLMAELDEGLGGFLDRVADRPVTVLVHSEFGRRVAINGSDGTDHGTSGPVFLCGSRVRGGFHGDEPSLTDLVDGDLRTTIDFRSVYASVLTEVVGIDPADVLPDARRYRAVPGLF